MKHFLLILFCASLWAQRPQRETLIQIFDRPNSTVMRQEFSSGTHVIFNSAGARRINQSSAGGTSTTVGILEVLTGAAGSETMVARMDTAGLRTTRDLRLEKSDGTYAAWQVSPAMTTSKAWQMPTTDAEGFLYSNGSAATSWFPITDIATLSTNQTFTGTKIFKAAITIEDALSSTDRSVLGSGTLNLLNTSGASRVLASSSNSLDSSTGIVRVFTGAPGAESMVAEMAANGMTATNFYTTAGVQLFNTSGTCVSCTIPWSRITGAPSSGGDMLLGTAQTVTAQKVFQMSFGGDAIVVRNSISQTRGTWSDATFSIGDIATGFGRGVQIATGGTLQIFNTSSQVAIRLSFSGSAGSIQVLDSGGVTRTGITQTCITTNGGQINFVAGIAYSCF